MPERRLGEPGPAFNPRLAALTHAAAAEQIAPGVGPVGIGVAQSNASLERVVAQLANTVACGLVYVGDELAKLRESLDVNLPAAGRGT